MVRRPSERQLEHARDYGTRPENVIAILPADAGMPTRSWWTDLRTREEFDAVADQEQRRMRDSKYGRLGFNTHGDG